MHSEHHTQNHRPEPARKRGLAERVGAWSSHHRKTAILGWIAFVVLATITGGSIGTRELTNAENTPGEAGQAVEVLTEAGLDPAAETVLVQSEDGKAGEPAFDAAVAEVAAGLRGLDDVENITVPDGANGLVSEDGHSALVAFEIAGDPDTAVDRVEPMLDEVASVQAANPDFTIEEFGAASGELAVSDVFSEDLKKAETLSLPLTLIILVIAFGSLVAAGIPLLLGITGVAATFGLIAIPSQVFPMSSEISSVILLVGLAVGVDYALFYLRREREERAKGRSPEEALQIASATAGRAVLVSGLTVIAAMAGMLLTGDGTFTSFGVGTMLVVAVAMAASVTVLPAVLAALGDKVDRGRLPRLRRKSRQQPRKPKAQGRIWIAIVDRVLRRPALSLILAGGALVALALPAVGMKLEVSGPEQLPQDLPIVQTYDRIQAAFPGENVPAVVAVSADDVESSQVAGAIDELTSVKGDGIYADRSTVEVSEDGTAARVEIPIAGTGVDAESKQALASLRDEVVPAAFEGVDAAVYVGGDTAETVDFTNKVEERLPLVFAFVLGLAFVLMMVTFRSIVVPIKAIVLNLLSVGAAYGVLVLVFQHGVGSELLGFDTPGFVTSWLPLFLFVILFGLSMDYHVLIVSRIREGVDRGLSTEAAVREGIAATAGTVTSAAVVMVAVFAVFASLTLIDMKEMGLGLAVAVLIDATIVRAVLLPASMKLLGKRNWYLPKALDWLPHTSHEVEPQPVAAR